MSRQPVVSFFALFALTMLVVSTSVAQEAKEEKADSGIRPPMDLSIEVPGPGTAPSAGPTQQPAQAPTKPQGQNPLEGIKITPQGQRLMVESGDQTIEFGLDMADRGIAFGLGFLHGHRHPGEARAFAHDMAHRGRSFAHQMGPQVEKILQETELPAEGLGAGGLGEGLLQTEGLPPELGDQLQQLRDRIRARIESRQGQAVPQRRMRIRREF